ncbi:MAG TPA: hypothetical protein VNR11_15895 [Xanthobacteraceae bacterium]|nr:hypothetical protein [Xanthobacteraceae bacterium]
MDSADRNRGPEAPRAARGPLVDLVSGEKIDLRRGLRLPAYGVKLLQARSAAP